MRQRWYWRAGPAEICRKTRKSSWVEHSADMHMVKNLRLLFYSLALLELVLLTAYQAWGKALLR
jgi:hypothetical protein